MGRYQPTLRVNRRRYLRAEDRPEVARVTALGVFIILIAFFVALVAWTAPNDDRTVDLIGTLQSTFKPLDNKQPELRDPPPVPDWMNTATADGETPPLQDMQRLFPRSVSAQKNTWGSVEMRFSPDDFQSLILGHSSLALRLFKGFSTARNGRTNDDFIVQVTVGTKGRSIQTATALLRKSEKDLGEVGVHASRILSGYENGTSDIVVRIMPADRYGGIL